MIKEAPKLPIRKTYAGENIPLLPQWFNNITKDFYNTYSYFRVLVQNLDLNNKKALDNLKRDYKTVRKAYFGITTLMHTGFKVLEK